MVTDAKPIILIADPEPRTLDMIFDPETFARLKAQGTLIVHAEGQRLGDVELNEALGKASVLIGQIDLPAERLAAMPNLKAVFNVEGNFLPNVDYQHCFERGIHVLNASPVFATSVAETALGMAIDLAREITATHEAFRRGEEEWGLASNAGSFLMTGSKVGIVGLGDLGSALRRMLVPFNCEVRVCDPWMTRRRILDQNCIPSTLDEVLSLSRIVFLFASVTSENEGFIGAKELARMQRGSVLLVMSRAGIVDFDALGEAVASGHVRAGIDVFPVEPLARDSPLRTMEGIILSSHRSGGMGQTFLEIGRLVVEDLELVLRGLPPQLCKRAERETVARFRSKPVDVS